MVCLHAQRLIQKKAEQLELNLLKHLTWMLDQWKNVTWNYETKFMHFGSNRQYVHRFGGVRYDSKYKLSTIKRNEILIHFS